MSHNAKAKAKGIGATSFFDLKAELVKKEAELTKAQASGETLSKGKKTDKKISQWARQNKGVKDRARRDEVELEAISQPTLESARAILERKAKVYEKLRKGKTGGLNDAQYDALLVDFDTDTNAATSKYYENDGDDDDDQNKVDENDPVIEYEDEFGRLRTAKRSEVPRNLLPREYQEKDEDEDLVIHDPTGYFPTYQPSEERQAEIAKQLAEQDKPLNVHYDASREVRNQGAGFYQFSGDEETRRAQMDELRKAREETEKARRELGAEDVRPGEAEGMRLEDPPLKAGSSKPTTSKAMEKRKRELEERRQLLEAKRRKTRPDHAPSSTPKPIEEAQGRSSVSASGTAASTSTSTPLAKTEPTPAPSATIDPFAALEAQAGPTQKPKGKETSINPATQNSDADTFLQELERDLLRPSKKKHR